jgi:hypothetical protein
MTETSNASSIQSPLVEQPKRMHPLLLIAASLGIYFCADILGNLIGQISLYGFAELVPHLMDEVMKDTFFLGFAWAFFVLPINLITLGLYHWRKWRKYRTPIVLAPSLFFLAEVIMVFIFHFPTASLEFKEDTGVALPKSARDFLSVFHQNYSARDENIYFFRCDPQDTETLIKALRLYEIKLGGPYESQNSILNPPKKGWPDAQTWTGVRAFHRDDSQTFTSYTITTSKDETEVYVQVQQ